MTSNDRKQEGASRKGRRAFVLHPSIKGFFSDHQQRYLLMVLLALVLTVIIVPKGGFVPGYYSPGDIASRNIKAPRDLLIPDQPLTEKKRQAAAQAVLPLYDFDPRTTVELTERLTALLADASVVVEKGTVEGGLTTDNDHALLADLSSDQLKLMARLAERPAISALLQQLVAPIMARFTVGNKQVFESGWGGGIVVRNLVSQKEQTLQDDGQVIGIGDAHDLLAARMQ
ncbi:MAG: phosphohydrolase, partial [Desulfuromonadaceae bacterium]|nr:phosphohydrolase [Desulfuromonadaceae bacterium]